MSFGLPLRTASPTTESVTMPLNSCRPSPPSTRPGVDEPRDVGLERERDHVGGQAGLDGAALLARGAVRLLEVTPLPAGVFWKAGMISS